MLPNALASTISLYLVVEDPDAHHDRARAAGEPRNCRIDPKHRFTVEPRL
jgi:hypothetical protein